MEEYFTCNEDVVGSNPIAGSKFVVGDLLIAKEKDKDRQFVFDRCPTKHYVFTNDSVSFKIKDDVVIVLAITGGNIYERCLLLLHKTGVVWGRCISTTTETSAWKCVKRAI